MAKPTNYEWHIFWMSKIISEAEKIKWRRYMNCECLNCWKLFTKKMDDLRKEDRPRTCGKCKFYNWESRIIKEWTNINWYIFVKEIKKNWPNRRCIVKDTYWRDKNVSYNWFLNWKIKKSINPITKHWMHNTSFYKIYRWILNRCRWIWELSKKYYKDRWIMCEWNNFDDFKYDMYNDYIKHIEIYWQYNTSIDRINVNWNYCKENCRWATNIEQMNNTTLNIQIPDKYKWQTLKDICIKNNINRWTFYYRYKRWWYSFEDSLKCIDKRFGKL